MSIASLFRTAPAAVPGGRHAAPETEERPAVAPDGAPGRHAAPDDEPAFDGDDLLDSLGFAYED